MSPGQIRRSPWIQRSIDVGASVFIVILILSAVWDPSIRVLHLLQAGIYISVMVLTRKPSAWAYGAGCFIAAFWNWINLVHTRFFTNGVWELTRTIQTGDLQRPDQIIAVFAVAAHFLLIAGCVVGFLQLRRRLAQDLLKFLGGGVLAVASFSAMIFLFGPQYLPLLRRVFGI